MPRLGFYAAADDVLPVMGFVFQECRVFEGYSEPDEPLRSFASPEQVHDALERRGRDGLGLMLYSPAMKGRFTVNRFALAPGAVPGKSWREQILGWGLIQMEWAGLGDSALPPSVTNHNSGKRARAWEQGDARIPPVDAWDFREVARLSRRINRHIASLGVRKHGSQPILPGADALLKSGAVVLALG
jgi:hypothetical protein